jgi:hypothetical protein|tara:strand:+ start:593 stop:826 length:234 start_codon:yes stop_codon:yes gene_type:complete
MAKTDDRFIEDRLAMMESEGWLDLIADLETIQEGVVNIDTMTDEKDLWEAKGQLAILRFILTLENTTKITMEQSNED